MKEIQTSPLMRDLKNNTSRFIVFQGSSGSAKTYTILQFIIIKCLGEWENKTIDIVRRTFPALKKSTMKDFFEILNKFELYDPNDHNKSDNYYYLGGNTIRFYSAEDEQKLRGLRRDYLYINEILEFREIDVHQMLMRTHQQVFCDYNPSATFHWFYDDFVDSDREDVYFKKCNFREHNPFLPELSKQQIMRYKETDYNLWRIYGLGERGIPEATIFPKFEIVTDKQFKEAEGEELHGMDFGFNHPTALVKVKYDGKNIYIKELLYKSELTSDLMVRELEKLRDKGFITSQDKIKGDSSRPEVIQDIYNAGFNMHKTKKGEKSVLRNINFLKKHKIHITEDSENLLKEIRAYQWKTDKEGLILDEPVKEKDDLIDATYYALEDKAMNRKQMGFGIIK